MVVHVHPLLYALQEGFCLYGSCLLKYLLPGPLICQPYFPGPEAGGPFPVAALGIELVPAVGIRKTAGKGLQVFPHQAYRQVQAGFGFTLFHDCIGL